MCAEEDDEPEVNEAIAKFHLIKAFLTEAELGLKIVAHLVSGMTPCKMVFDEYKPRSPGFFNVPRQPTPLFRNLCSYAMPIKYPRVIRQGSVSPLIKLLLLLLQLLLLGHCMSGCLLARCLADLLSCPTAYLGTAGLLACSVACRVCLPGSLCSVSRQHACQAAG